ncbi:MULTISPECIES: amidohydrolase family protein [unclassified Sphingopyxis]|jgi:imidazolonepropionase-like amidohydrolase|uniref:metal-dependent hydrolase family protein n=1 Tax=unclassified Sphingopyxis TaxID=2614943 RepID=UPI00073077BB|nr:MULTISPECIES: amidohydrolase family protein [unclassified Sphingopyxis]KTE27841.1 Xaa-Pro dipeptidase [Sphingopyxis sp. H057]KTE55779.1 Xaa-Pro dipeptidase [Sphingopyxis sp. H073]KTE57340.1 Xaa-Pro dipeptidase [Sphingopyxis sp. H071]KTE61427.1 Xaa-Pro dipeptidase [Sphingopyxis sp. H107]KTE65242.1 Xaa-Pro dipeptidase [Sphingopyxis sp. H100]
MRSIRLVAAATLALLSGTAIAKTTVVYAGRVITDASKPALGPSTVVVTDDRITSIAPGRGEAPAGAEIVDLGDKTLLPGLIDLHVHLTGDPGGDYRSEAVDPDEWGVVVGAKNARLTLRAGFTTVREAGSAQYTAFALRRGTAEGMIEGPRIVAAGPPLSIIGGHGDVTGFREDVHAVLDQGYTCTGAIECAEKVRKASRAGADVIKITATGGVLSQQGRGLEGHFSNAELVSIADTAHSLGLRVMAHAHGARGIESAAAAGIDSIEHGTFADDAALKVMKAKGSYLVPTLMAFEGIKERLGKGIYTPTVEAKVRMTMNDVGKAVGRAKALGVPIAFGTDAGVFEHGRNAGEFALLVKYGLTPREALASATTVAAKLLSMEDQIGRIAPGLSADMIAVAGDPLSDVAVLEKVDWVMVRGRAAD